MILDKIYINAMSCVLVNSVYSRTLRQIRCLFQGGMLAPTLCVLYINELLKKLTRMKKRFLYSRCTPSMSNTTEWYCSYLSLCNMQNMLVMCENYSSKWWFTFSSQKSEIRNFSIESDADVSLCNKQLPKTTTIMHVGIKLQSGCHPHGLSLKRVKNLCVAKSLYGCELWNALSRNELLALERAFRFSIKNIHPTLIVLFWKQIEFYYQF